MADPAMQQGQPVRAGQGYGQFTPQGMQTPGMQQQSPRFPPMPQFAPNQFGSIQQSIQQQAQKEAAANAMPQNTVLRPYAQDQWTWENADQQIGQSPEFLYNSSAGA